MVQMIAESPARAPQFEIGGCEISGFHPDAVELARASMPSLEGLERSSTLLKAVADPTRLRMLWALSSTRLCVCDLAEVIGQSLSATSHQLRYLREAKLVRFEKLGRAVYYTLSDDHVKTLLGAALEHALE